MPGIISEPLISRSPPRDGWAVGFRLPSPLNKEILYKSEKFSTRHHPARPPTRDRLPPPTPFHYVCLRPLLTLWKLAKIPSGTPASDRRPYVRPNGSWRFQRRGIFNVAQRVTCGLKFSRTKFCSMYLIGIFFLLALMF